MARITIEDCMKRVPNRFQLVQMAAIRAKQLKRGATAFLDKDTNKEVVTALREIAAGIVKPDMTEVPDIDPLFVPRGQSSEPAAENPVADAPGKSVPLEASEPVQEPSPES